METNVNYTIVGIFVITLITAIILGIIWLSSGFSLTSRNTYKIYMQESVTGLNIDSTVEYNGVAVGGVSSITLNTKNPQLVELLINVDSNTPITRGTVATLQSRGVTGVTLVALKDRSTDLRPLLPLPGQKYAVIPSAPSLFTRLDTALGQITKNLSQVADAISSLLNRENQESFRKILINIQTVTEGLASNNARMTSILENTAEASRQMVPLLKSSTTTFRTLETQTLPSTYRLLNNLDNITRSLNEVATELKQNPSVIIRGIDRQQSLGPGENR